MSKNNVWIVYLHGQAIDRIIDWRDKDLVRRHLIEEEGYDPKIVLKRPWER